MEIYGYGTNWKAFRIPLFVEGDAIPAGQTYFQFPIPFQHVRVVDCGRDCTVFAGNSAYLPIAKIRRGSSGTFNLPLQVDGFTIQWEVLRANIEPNVEAQNLYLDIAIAETVLDDNESVQPVTGYNYWQQDLVLNNNYALQHDVEILQLPENISTLWGLGNGGTWRPVAVNDGPENPNAPQSFPLDVNIRPSGTDGNQALDATFATIIRRSVRPYRLQVSFAAAGRQCLAAIWNGTSIRNTRINRIEAALWNSNAAAEVMIDINRITTAPAGGTLITAQSVVPTNLTSNLLIRGAPASGAAESANQPWYSASYDLGITGAAGTINPPHGTEWMTLWDDEWKGSGLPMGLVIGIASGIGIFVDSNAVGSVFGFVRIVYTEYD